MYASLRRLALMALVALAPSVAQAQVYSPFYRPGVVPGGLLNPNPYIAPGVSLQQYAYNRAVLTQAAYGMYPYQPGYSPYQYPGLVLPSYAPSYVAPTVPYVPPVSYNPYLSTVGNPYLSNPYGVNPYLATSGGYANPVLSTTASYGSPGYDTTLRTTPYGGGYGG